MRLYEGEGAVGKQPSSDPSGSPEGERSSTTESNYSSSGSTSFLPSARVARERRIAFDVVSRMNTTCPSANTANAPLPWKLNISLFGPQSCWAQAQPSTGSAVV